MDIIPQKQCFTCKQARSVSEYHRNRKSPDGLQDRCKSCAAEANRKYYQKHREQILERQQLPEVKALHRKHSLEWTRRNRQRARIASLRNWAANKDSFKRRLRAWRLANPGKTKAQKQLRRARVMGGGGSFTAQEWQDLCARYNHQCLRCKRTDVKLTADHVLPVSKGGSSNIDNIQPLCLSCNSGKKDRHIDYR